MEDSAITMLKFILTLVMIVMTITVGSEMVAMAGGESLQQPANLKAKEQ
jgi:hypothetical protein